MASMDFPDFPTIGQEYTVDGRTWVWTGATWDAKGTSIVVGPAGPPGVVAATLPATYDAPTQAVGVDQDAFTHISNLNYAQFDTSNTVSPATPGRMAWNDTDGTLDLYLKDGDVTLQVGQEYVLRAVNKSGTALVNGAAVYVSGAQGQRVKVGLATSTGETASQNTIGIVTSLGGIANNAEGYITLRGLVRGIDTKDWLPGDELWLASTPGTYTNIEPLAPQHNIRMGWVIKDGPNGSILVDVLALSNISELNDVLITSAVSGNFLKYNGSLWVNSNVISGGTA